MLVYVAIYSLITGRNIYRHTEWVIAHTSLVIASDDHTDRMGDDHTSEAYSDGYCDREAITNV